MELDGYVFRASTKKGYKYDVFDLDGHPVASFGRLPYEHYHDKIGFWRMLDHGNEKRRDRYRARHKKLTLEDGREAYKVKGTPAYFSWNYLW